jgi:two-component system C4-dicarboxylate transport sensor histidine kinase DctB
MSDKFQNYFNLAPLGIIHILENGNIIDSNNYFNNIFNNKPKSLFELMYSENLEQLQDIIQKVLTSKKRLSTKITCKRVIDSDVVFNSIVDFFDKDEVIITLDNTTIENSNFNQNTKEEDERTLAQSRYVIMGEMMGNIAHQWRQPLNMIALKKSLFVEQYFDNELTEEIVDKYDEDIDRVIQDMSKTIDDFRNFFTPSYDKTIFRVEDAISDTLNIVSDALKNNYIEISLDIPDDCEIFGYRNEFEQVLLNIVSNSKDAIKNLIETNKIQIGKINIKVYQEENSITVEICDNGGGIPQDIIDKIFDPYFTTKFKSQGTGIGLYMSKTIIEKNMEGKLKVFNKPEGACFEISLVSSTIE